jgi:hypothetical protein
VYYLEKVRYETLDAEPKIQLDKKGSVRNLWYETFVSFVERRFDTKPVLYRTKKGSSRVVRVVVFPYNPKRRLDVPSGLTG